jgi:hypothetical protein
LISDQITQVLRKRAKQLPAIGFHAEKERHPPQGFAMIDYLSMHIANRR